MLALCVWVVRGRMCFSARACAGVALFIYVLRKSFIMPLTTERLETSVYVGILTLTDPHYA